MQTTSLKKQNSLSNSEAIAKIKAQGLPVIIFGADVVGEVIFYACQEAGIPVEFFCDNNKNKIKYKHCGLDIVHASEIKNKFPQATILIASTYIRDIVTQVESMGYSEWYDCGVFLKNFDIYKYETLYSREMHFVEFAVGACLLSHDGYMDSERLYIRSVDLIITEKCSLKCKDCSNLMQFYEKPINLTLDELFESIDKLCTVADEIYEMRVIGGEPLVNKDYHAIIDKLNHEPKVKRVVIYSNGTILPREEHIPILKNEKVIFIFTSYGELSVNLDKIKTRFDQHGVNYVVQKANGWTDSGSIVKFNRTEEELEETFKYCCVKNYSSISSGKLFRCPFSANADRLRATPDFKEDYFDLFTELRKEQVDLADVKKRLKDFLLNKKFLKACDFCKGRTYGMPEIEPGIQADKPLAYTKYQA